MNATYTRRIVEDIWSVCRSAEPGAASRWIASLAARVPECASSRSLIPADRTWARTGARFRTPSGDIISLPPEYTAGAREMYCRNVYLRTGLSMPRTGWVIDLGANCGLFSVWAALAGTQVIAVEAQEGYAATIANLAAHNGVAQRVTVETRTAGGARSSGADVGAIADAGIWAAAPYGAPVRPPEVSVPELLSTYMVDSIGLLKMDIEGGEFAVLAPEEDLSWLDNVSQVAMEIHRAYGDTSELIDRIQRRGFIVDLRDNDGRQVGASSEGLLYVYCYHR